MKIRYITLLAVISLFAAGNSWAQNGGANNNINFNNNVNNFGAGSFSVPGGNMTISQGNISDPGSFCQFFSYTFGMTQIIQIIQGNSFSQVFGAPSDVEDPCL